MKNNSQRTQTYFYTRPNCSKKQHLQNCYSPEYTSDEWTTYRVENEHLTEEVDNFMITVIGEAVKYRKVGLMRCST